MSANYYTPVSRKCPICSQFHSAASETAYSRKVDECRNSFIGYLVNREYMRKVDTLPSYSGPDAETKGGDK